MLKVPACRSAFGYGMGSAIGIVVNPYTKIEWKTWFLMTSIIPDKTTDESIGSWLDVFPIFADTDLSDMHSNGAEFIRHARLHHELGVAEYFTDHTPSGSEPIMQFAMPYPQISFQTLWIRAGMVQEV